MTFDYYYGDESHQFSFYRVPRLLMTGENFKQVSADAKLLYGLLLDRMSLSAKNGWYDKLGRVYIYYTLVELLVEAICSTRPTLRIGGEEIPTDHVRSRLWALNSAHLEYVFDSLHRNTTQIRNIRAYLLTALYNAPITINSYYQAEVQHDFGP